MSYRYFALLRGINVGRANRIAMADLRALLADLGHRDVKTMLQSGNVLLTSTEADPEAVAAAIVRAIGDELGLTIPCLVRQAADLQRVIDANPLPHTDDPKRLLVTFLSDRVDPDWAEAFDAVAYEPERFAAGDREIYTYHPEGIQNSKLTYALFEKQLKVTATARNWNTVTKLRDLA